MAVTQDVNLCIAVSLTSARHQMITGASPDDQRRVSRSRPDESTLDPGPGFLFESRNGLWKQHQLIMNLPVHSSQAIHIHSLDGGS
jgi:hypothetical protein